MWFPVIEKKTLHKSDVKAFTARLIESLRELQKAYPILLETCRNRICDAFHVDEEKQSIRENLRIRANALHGRVIENRMSGFIGAAIDKKAADKQWLESVIMTLTGKPARLWNDDDCFKFELSVEDLARRFSNLEAIHSDLIGTRLEGSDAMRLSLTHPDGEEINKMVWVHHADRFKMEMDLDNTVIKRLGIENNMELQKAYIATWIKKIDEEEMGRDKTEIRSNGGR